MAQAMCQVCVFMCVMMCAPVLICVHICLQWSYVFMSYSCVHVCASISTLNFWYVYVYRCANSHICARVWVDMCGSFMCASLCSKVNIKGTASELAKGWNISLQCAEADQTRSFGCFPSVLAHTTCLTGLTRMWSWYLEMYSVILCKPLQRRVLWIAIGQPSFLWLSERFMCNFWSVTPS